MLFRVVSQQPDRFQLGHNYINKLKRHEKGEIKTHIAPQLPILKDKKRDLHKSVIELQKSHNLPPIIPRYSFHLTPSNKNVKKLEEKENNNK